MSKPSWLSNKYLAIFIWVVAIAIRLYGASRPAQYYDMGTFEAWSRSFWVHGPLAFFDSVWSDYLPLPILTFAPISLLANFLSTPFSLTFKITHLLIELVLIFFITRSRSKELSLVSYLLLLSPALIGDTSFWGQVDTLPALLTLLSFTQLPTPLSPIFLGLAIAYKPIMILVAPILWIMDIQRGHPWRLPLISSLVFFLTALPFVDSPNLVFSHLLSRAVSQSGTYPYLTINAFNLWSLVPNMAWISDTTSVLSLSGRNLGYLLFFVSTMITLNSWRKTGFTPTYGYRVAATILITFYTFTTRMHERHLLFGLPFLTLATFYEPWLIVPLSLLTLTFTFNLYGAFYWVVHNQTWPFGAATISILSWVTLLTTIALTLIWSWPIFWQKFKNLFIKNFYLVVILLLAAFLRYGNLSYPNSYIFDEVYHGFTAREYLHNHIEAWEWWTTPPEGVAYEWTHPPLAKYGMVVGMLLFGENSFGWRVGSATFGVLSILGLYYLTLALTKNKSLALLSAFLVAIEGTHIAQSRIAMNDIYMLCAFIWSLYAAVKSRWKTAAFLYGLALSSKWSALYGVIPLALIYLHDYPFKFRFSYLIFHIFSALRLLLISLAVYILTFAPFILAGHTWQQWWELHRQMWYYHTHLVATHGYQSTPREWLFDLRPVWYYVKYLGNSISNIYVIGNPIILWGGLVALLVQVKKLRQFPHLLFTITYLIFTLPWLISPRIMFYYHYLPSSTFLTLILATLLADLTPRLRFLLLLLSVFGLLLIAPMLYGFPMSTSYWDTLFKLIPSWK